MSGWTGLRARSDSAPSILHFGGPDRPARLLRDLLQARVEATPPGGRIDWATYYFRDEALADSLIRAVDRGVRVRLTMEAAPRRKDANRAVIARLREHGLGGGLRLFRPSGPLHPHLHAKIYAFSAPVPVALIGSFNPSGNDPEDGDVIAEIGDQDRGHNLLLELADPTLVAALVDHAARLPLSGGLLRSRFGLRHNMPVSGVDAVLYRYPRLRTGQVEREIAALGEGDRVLAAISHLKGRGFVTALGRAAAAGAAISMIVHDTERRVPQRDVARLAAAGIDIRRFRHPDGLPMHAKFVLIARRGGGDAAWLGSANFNPRSRWINQEVLLRTTEPAVLAGLAQRFARIADDRPPAPGGD